MATARHQVTASPREHREKLHDIVKGARDVLLLSHGDGGKITGRPMAVARVDDDTTMYLVAAMASTNLSEVVRDSRVSIAIQDRNGCAMIDGDCRVSQYRPLIDELWQDSWKPWFDGGKADPAIAILVISPIEGTYWAGGLGHGLSYLFRMVKARVAGDEIETKPSDHNKVKLT